MAFPQNRGRSAVIPQIYQIWAGLGMAGCVELYFHLLLASEFKSSVCTELKFQSRAAATVVVTLATYCKSRRIPVGEVVRTCNKHTWILIYDRTIVVG
jgi:hypothetical protein